MKYKIINQDHIFYGRVFNGEPIIINNEHRIWNNETVGHSYSEKDCIVYLEIEGEK